MDENVIDSGPDTVQPAEADHHGARGRQAPLIAAATAAGVAGAAALDVASVLGASVFNYSFYFNWFYAGITFNHNECHIEAPEPPLTVDPT